MFLDSYAYLLRIVHFRSKSCIFVILYKNIIFSGCIGYAEIFFFFMVEYKPLILILDDANV